jgi:hypothetical protein
MTRSDQLVAIAFYLAIALLIPGAILANALS